MMVPLNAFVITLVTLKVQIITTADGMLKYLLFYYYYYYFVRENKTWLFMWIACLVDGLLEMPSLTSSEKERNRLSSATVLCVVLTVNLILGVICYNLACCFNGYIYFRWNTTKEPLCQCRMQATKPLISLRIFTLRLRLLLPACRFCILANTKGPD